MMAAPEGNTNAARALKPYESNLAATLPPEHEMGPAMRALPERWRVVVMCYLTQTADLKEPLSRVTALRDAGYEGQDATLKVTAHYVFHDARIQAAILEEGRKQLQGGVIKAGRALMRQLDDADPKVVAKAAGMILDRGGLPAVSQVEHKNVTPLSLEQRLELAAGFAARLGIDPAVLIGTLGSPAPTNVPRDITSVADAEIITNNNQEGAGG